MAADARNNTWTALIGAVAGALLSGASLSFWFGGEMRQIAMNRQSIIELRNQRAEEASGTNDAIQKTRLEAVNKQIETLQQQIANGRNALIAENARIGVLESRVEDLRREVEANRRRLP